MYAYFVEPMFESLQKRYQCHLQYRQPSKLYQIEYEVTMPSIGQTLRKRTHVVKPSNKTYHQHGSFKAGFIMATHNSSLPKIHSEVILVGNRYRDLTPTKFVLHKLKNPEEFDRRKNFRVRPHRADKASNVYSTHAQFERPFLYSSVTWNRGGCFSKNFSQIYPRQHLYTSDAVEIDPTILKSGDQFVYQTAGKVATIKIEVQSKDKFSYF